jgi:hypothetical protein
MQDIKLTRWATYLVPGSIVVLSAWIISKSFFEDMMDSIISLPSITGIELYVYFALSYVVGIALWGVCYSKRMQILLRFRSHDRRLELIKEFLRSEWRQKAYLDKMKKYFSSIPKEKENIENFDYYDFEFIIASVHQTASTEMNNRIVQDRETIGLIQTLILGLYVLSFSLFILTIVKVIGRTWQPAIGLFFAMLATLILTKMLYVHYERRQRYLVRDTLMAFPSMEVTKA